MNVLLLAGALAMLAGVIYRLAGTRGAGEQSYLVVRCSACDQKVRYCATQAGAIGHCPRCLKQVHLPRTAEPLTTPRRPHRIGERVSADTGSARSRIGVQRATGA